MTYSGATVQWHTADTAGRFTVTLFPIHTEQQGTAVSMGENRKVLKILQQVLTRGPTQMEQMAPHSRDTSTDATGARHGSDHTNTRRPCRCSRPHVRHIQVHNSQSGASVEHVAAPAHGAAAPAHSAWKNAKHASGIPRWCYDSTTDASWQPTEAAYSRPAASSRCATGLAARSSVPTHLHVSRSHTCRSCTLLVCLPGAYPMTCFHRTTQTGD